MAIIRSLLIFILAGLFEIGGGYLVWQWLKEGKPLWYGLLGGVILTLYGVVATWQTARGYTPPMAVYLLCLPCYGPGRLMVSARINMISSEPLLP